jgi:hypothetical protein
MEQYGLGYDEGYYAGRSQAKVDRAMGKGAADVAGASGSLLGIVFLLALRLINLLIICSGPIVTTYWMMKTFKLPTGNSEIGQLITLAAGTLITASIIFLLKGLLISLKERNSVLWLVAFVICFGATTIVPVLAIERVAGGLLHLHSGTALTWGVAVLCGAYTYFKYGLIQDSAPVLFKWAYAIGRSF